MDPFEVAALLVGFTRDSARFSSLLSGWSTEQVDQFEAMKKDKLAALLRGESPAASADTRPALDLPAEEALRILEDVLKKSEIDAWKHARLEYHSSIPLYTNGSRCPRRLNPPAGCRT